MKSRFFLVIFFVLAGGVFAQPVLISSNVSPLARETFVRHSCGVSHVTQGTAGAGVTWDYRALASITTDTITYLACTGAGICDSFPGSLLASANASNYEFYAPDTSEFATAGQGSSGGNFK